MNNYHYIFISYNDNYKFNNILNFLINTFNVKKNNIHYVNSKNTENAKNTENIRNIEAPNSNEYNNIIKNITIENFNYNYYKTKYSDLSHMNKDSLWKHWINHGINEKRNPIDDRNILTSNDIILSSLIINSLLFKCDNKIIIIVDDNINTLNSTYDIKNLDNIFKDIGNIDIDTKIYTHSINNKKFLYYIRNNIINDIIMELSLNIYNLDKIINIFQNSRLLGGDFKHNNLNFIKTQKNALKPVENVSHNLSIADNIEIYDLKSHIKAYKNNILLKICNGNGNENGNENKLSIIHNTEQYLSYEKIRKKYINYCLLSYKEYINLCINPYNYGEYNIIFSHNISKYNTIVFSDTQYLEYYPCYSKVLKSPDQLYDHFKKYGVEEKLICNKMIFEIVKLKQLYNMNIYNYNLLHNINFENYCNNKNHTTYYILTRTCNRKILYNECRDSIISQISHKNNFDVVHLVSYDNIETYEYVNNTTDIMINLIKYKNKEHPNNYIDHFYDIVEKYDGWVIVLDDDDKFLNSHILEYISNYTTDKDNLIIWMYGRYDKFIYPINKDKPVVGEVASCAYCYHTSKVKSNIWHSGAIGDFNFFDYIFNISKNHIYIDIPLTISNQISNICGWSSS